MSHYVAIICRISKDKGGRVEGVRAQERWGRAYAERMWPDLPVRAYADNDISAADNTHRPEFERFRADLRAGVIAHVWAVEQSRLERREAEWFRLAAELDAAGITELHTNRDGIVRVLDDVAGIKAVLAAGEVRKLRKRVNDKLDENAARGVPAGGRVLGYARGRSANGDRTLVIIESEAAIIRQCADRVLSGWSLGAIATDLTSGGQVGVTNRPVRGQDGQAVTVDGRAVEDGGTAVTRPGVVRYNTVKSWLTNAAVAGLRQHRGVIVGPGNWPAILDESTWRAINHKLTGPRVVATTDGGEYRLSGRSRVAGRRYLLTGGIAVCGVCSAPLIASIKQMHGRRTPDAIYYVCHRVKGGKGCVGIMGERFEAYVVDTLLAELDKPEFLAAVASDTHAPDRDRITAELAGLDAQRSELARMWGRRQLTAEEWQAARGQLAEDGADLRRQLAELPPPLHHIGIAGVREAWPLMTLDERREIIGMFVARVAVNRATPGTRGFDPSRVAPPDTWWRRCR